MQKHQNTTTVRCENCSIDWSEKMSLEESIFSFLYCPRCRCSVSYTTSEMHEFKAELSHQGVKERNQQRYITAVDRFLLYSGLTYGQEINRIDVVNYRTAMKNSHPGSDDSKYQEARMVAKYIEFIEESEEVIEMAKKMRERFHDEKAK